LAHITITTGHLRMSPRHEVRPDVITFLIEWLDSAPLVWMPETDRYERLAIPPHAQGYGLRFEVHGTTLWADLIHERFGSCLQFAVGCDASGDEIWAAMSDEPRPALPWCGVALDVGWVILQMVAPDDVLWFGDFERCVAWAWIELVKTQGGLTPLSMPKAA
jgi:hypothetical protein